VYAFLFSSYIYVISIKLLTRLSDFSHVLFLFIPFPLPPLSFLQKNVNLQKVFVFQIDTEAKKQMYHSTRGSSDGCEQIV